MSAWYVYMLRCGDGSIYTGISNNVSRRVAQHAHGTRGARYTRGRRPVTLVYQEACDSKSTALKREIEIKKLPREKKQCLILAQAQKASQSAG